jgi:hypothetical protein
VHRARNIHYLGFEVFIKMAPGGKCFIRSKLATDSTTKEEMPLRISQHGARKTSLKMVRFGVLPLFCNHIYHREPIPD